MTATEGSNFLFLLTIPIFWMMGLCAFIARPGVGLWNINQPPILQEINFSEVQGKISTANQFLEEMGSGSGPIIAGNILVVFNQNYQLTFLITLIFGIIGGLL